MGALVSFSLDGNLHINICFFKFFKCSGNSGNISVGVVCAIP